MELTQLRAFVTIAKLGQLTRAAERLHLSQPALSGQLKALEEALGLSLFERSSSGMNLTAGGRALLPEAEGIIESVQRLRQSARQLQGRPAGRLKLGTVLDPATLRLGEFLARAVESHPLIDIELHQLFSGAALDAVREGSLDASFFFGSVHDGELRAEFLRTLTYRVALPAAWDTERDAEWASIAAKPWILAPPTSSHRQLAMELFGAHGDEPQQVSEADSEAVILNLVESGVGVSILRDDIARAAEREGRIAIWWGAEMTTRLWFICLAARAGDPTLDAALGVLRDVWRVEAPTPA
ncbi:MAG TPA: LysR family transcriptional regulator [Casimicrobiaceae bacterium]